MKPATQEKKRRGGFREGAGRPKKKAQDLQKTHSLRATDKDWDLIQIAARVIKSTKTDKKSRVLVLSDGEFRRVNSILWEEVRESRYPKNESAEVSRPTALDSTDKAAVIPLEMPKKLAEEEAVSVFLEYFRLNPEAASSYIMRKLEDEKRTQRQKQIHLEQEEVMDKLCDESKEAIKLADDINKRISEFLMFPG